MSFITNTFLFFINTIFPFLGEFFGKLTALASESYINILDYVSLANTYDPIKYVNLYTGISDYLTPIDMPYPELMQTILMPVVSLLKGILTFLPNDCPFVIALLLLFFVFGIGISVVKFFVNLF